MSRQCKYVLPLLVVAIIIAGCRSNPPPQPRPGPGQSVPEGAISVQQLAQGLGLTILKDTPPLVTLRNARNNVMLVAGANGQAYVNGLRVGPSGNFARVGGTLFIPATQSDIRSALNPLTQLPTPAPLPSPNPLIPQPKKLQLRQAYKIVIDPGHGGKDPGTTSRTGLMEKVVVLAVADLAHELKQDGFPSCDDAPIRRFVELDDRAAVANRISADLFVSIHANSCPDPTMRGFKVYTNRAPSRGSWSVASDVAEALRSAIVEGPGRREANYRVLVVAECPSILVELGYLSNGTDAERSATMPSRRASPTTIADGIGDYFRR